MISLLKYCWCIASLIAATECCQRKLPPNKDFEWRGHNGHWQQWWWQANVMMLFVFQVTTFSAVSSMQSVDYKLSTNRTRFRTGTTTFDQIWSQLQISKSRTMTRQRTSFGCMEKCSTLNWLLIRMRGSLSDFFQFWFNLIHHVL